MCALVGLYVSWLLLFRVKVFGLFIGGFVGLVGCECRYCRLRCSILVAMRHGQIIYWFVFKGFGMICLCVCEGGGGLVGFM